MKILFTSIIKKIRAYAAAHKFISAIIVVVILGGGYWTYGKLTSTLGETRYVLAAVEKGTLIVSITGSGQVSSSNQIDIKPKASGDIMWVGVTAGQEVGEGQMLFQLDATEAQKELHDAELDLEETKLQLDKSVAQAPIDYQRKLETLKKSKDNLEKTYEDTFNTVSGAFLDLPAVITGTQDVLFGGGLSANNTQWNISIYKSMFGDTDKDLVNTLADIADRDYRAARADYDKSLITFKNTDRYAEKPAIETLLTDTLTTTKSIAQAVKSETNLIDAIVDIAGKRSQKVSTLITTYQTNLRAYMGTTNSNLSSLLGQKRSLEDAKEAITNNQRDIDVLLINNVSGANPVDLQIAQNGVKKKEAAIADLRAKLADYTVRASFAGVVARVVGKRGDSVSSATSLGALVTKQKIAELSLNEVDAARIKTGQKATLTFDAVDGLSLTGVVAEVDTVGAVTQGVVTYGVKISFDTNDDRVKSGMSVSAAIITDIKQDTLLVPISAVKTQGSVNYVEMFDTSLPPPTAGTQGSPSATTPRQQQVEIGISNDTLIEIISGLKEGDQVVSRTVAAQTTTAASQAPSLFGGAGNRAATGGGAVRTQTQQR